MTKVYMEFDFKDEEDVRDYHLATRAKPMAFILTRLDEELRKKVKHAKDHTEVEDTYQKVRDLLHSLADEENIVIEALFE